LDALAGPHTDRAMYRTGERCAIFDKIDALDQARTQAELVSRLKPILADLAYYAVTGEAAVMDTREEWLTTFTDRLHEAVRSEQPAPPRASPHAAPHAPYAAAPERPTGGRPAVRTARPPPSHPPATDIPLSLRQIMDGSHASFRED
jgi:hypothetical protein